MSIVKVLFLVILALIPALAGATQPTITFHSVTNDTDLDSYTHGLRLSEVTFEEQPWLTEDDLVSWDVSSGYIFLAGDRGQYLKKFDVSLSGGGYLGFSFKLFVVLVNGEPCFIGEFHSAVSSMAPRYPFIGDMSMHWAPVDALVMNAKTWDPKFVTALKDLGLYRGGLEVILTDVRLENNEALSKTTVAFDVELTNRDQGDLMILDPDRMVPGFHGYRPWLFVEAVGSNRNKIPEQMRRPGGINPFDQEWLVKMPAGRELRFTLTREIELLEPGTYDCRLLFPGPRDTGGQELDIGDARLWYGQVVSNDMVVQLK